jgi:Spy/CpxP family protein refolding chaperone
MMRKRIAALFAALAVLAAVAPGAMAADFGAGNSSAGPHDANAKCHPPGQTSDLAPCR